jgi:hypothetical protein
MAHCAACEGYCVAKYIDKFHPKGERMVRSFMAGNYDIVMKHLYKNPHLFLYEAGPYSRNIFRYAIFRTVERGEDYIFLQLLLEFGRANLSLEEYSEWLNSHNFLGIGVGTYYKYPIYKNDLKMVRFLLNCGIPFPSNIILCCVSNSVGKKFRTIDHKSANHGTIIEMMFEFLSRGADPSGCELHKLYSWSYLSFTFPIMMGDQIYKSGFKQMLELLYIYGIDFDRGNKLADKSNFSIEDEYNRYQMMGVIGDNEGLPLFWLSSYFYEIVCGIMFGGEIMCDNEIMDGSENVRSNILCIFILYFSDKYNVDFSLQSQGPVAECFNHFLTNGIYKLTIESVRYVRNSNYIRDDASTNDMSILNVINNKMKFFISLTEQKIPFLLYLIGNPVNKIFEYSFVREIILLYI